MNAIHPFKITTIDDGINIYSACHTDNYFELFEKHGYYGNGYCWLGHIRQILEKENPALLKKSVLDGESDYFFATFKNVETFNAAMKILDPIFQDYDILEKYIIAADRDRIDA